jgi:hypothetical protein
MVVSPTGRSVLSTWTDGNAIFPGVKVYACEKSGDEISPERVAAVSAIARIAT